MLNMYRMKINYPMNCILILLTKEFQNSGSHGMPNLGGMLINLSTSMVILMIQTLLMNLLYILIKFFVMMMIRMPIMISHISVQNVLEITCNLATNVWTRLVLNVLINVWGHWNLAKLVDLMILVLNICYMHIHHWQFTYSYCLSL